MHAPARCFGDSLIDSNQSLPSMRWESNFPKAHWTMIILLGPQFVFDALEKDLYVVENDFSRWYFTLMLRFSRILLTLPKVWVIKSNYIYGMSNNQSNTRFKNFAGINSFWTKTNFFFLKRRKKTKRRKITLSRMRKKNQGRIHREEEQPRSVNLQKFRTTRMVFFLKNNHRNFPRKFV